VGRGDRGREEVDVRVMGRKEEGIGDRGRKEVG